MSWGHLPLIPSIPKMWIQSLHSYSQCKDTFLTQIPSVLLKSIWVAIVYVLERIKKISGRPIVGIKSFFHDPLGEVFRDPVLLLDGWLLLPESYCCVCNHTRWIHISAHGEPKLEIKKNGKGFIHWSKEGEHRQSLWGINLPKQRKCGVYLQSLCILVGKHVRSEHICESAQLQGIAKEERCQASFGGILYSEWWKMCSRG